MPQQRLPAGEPNFLDAQAGKDTDDSLDFLEGKNMGFGDPLLDYWRGIGHVRPVAPIEIVRRLGFRQAVQAAKIATIGDAYPQVAQNAAMRIDQ